MIFFVWDNIAVNFIYFRRNFIAMEKTVKANGKKNRIDNPKPKKKSKFTLFWEKYPHGVVKILDHEAVLQ